MYFTTYLFTSARGSTILTGTLTLGPNYAFIIGLLGIMIGILFMYKITFFLGKMFLRNFKKSDGYKKYKKFPVMVSGRLHTIVDEEV